MSSNPTTGAQEPPEAVRGFFSRIAGRYDLANTVLSAGMDAYWRWRATRLVRSWQPAMLLDLATGSGVLAASLARACPGLRIIGADFCPPMLQRARASGRLTRLVAADGLRLPFANGAFDAVTVAFGLRNMASWEEALREMRRVLKPGGRLLVLDFSLPRGWWRRAYLFYLRRCLPLIAGIVAGEREAYDYLAASIQAFPSGEAMLDLLRAAGFEQPVAVELTGGMVSLYSGVTPSS